MKTEVRFRRAGAVFELVYHALRARLADQAESASVSVEAGGAAPETAPPPLPPANPAAVLAPAAPPGRIGDQPERPLRLVADAPAQAAQQVPLGLGYGRGAPVPQPAPPPAGRHSAAAPRYAALRVIGQIFAGFIALEGDDGLILIDQHAAHERVTFEKLRTELREGQIRVQPMLTPVTLELNPARAGQVAGALPELRAMGFEVEMFGPAALLVKGAPAVFGPEGGAKLLADMIDSMGDHGFRPARRRRLRRLPEDARLSRFGTRRPGSATARNQRTAGGARRTEFKTNCPHGRPVHIEFRRGSIERMFRR